MFADISPEWMRLLNEADVDQISERVRCVTPCDARVCPPRAAWFNWARLTPLDAVRVIIIGQDPYYTLGTANGLAFSCPAIAGRGVPPSLRNIYECLHSQGLIDRVPNHGRLDEWAARGVLLLNSALSTELGTPKKHAHIWEDYVRVRVMRLSEYGREQGVKYTFLLWGKAARAFVPFIDARHHYVHTWIHPSPMAQVRAAPQDRFLSCPHFAVCTERYGINWSIF